MKKCIFIVIVILPVLVVFYILSSPKYLSPIQLPRVRNVFESLPPYCRKIEDIIDGRWVKKEGLTTDDMWERNRIDAKIRWTNGWPTNMIRKDSRCGRLYPIRKDLLQGICDPESANPCCNPIKGECGNTTEHCLCDKCIDMKKYIDAEIANWIPKTCRVREFSPMEACELSNRHKVNIFLTGDSLMRQLNAMFIMTLTGDFEEGTFHKDMNNATKKLCRGELQVTNKRCCCDGDSLSLLKSPVCEGRTMFKLHYRHDLGHQFRGDVNGFIGGRVGMENSWIICGVGLHYKTNFTMTKINYMDKLWAKIKQGKNGWPKLLWINIQHLPDHLLFQDFPQFEEKIIRNFNKQATDYWAKRNVPVIHTYEISKFLNTFDGIHYGVGFNRLKMDIILGFIHQYYEETNGK